MLVNIVQLNGIEGKNHKHLYKMHINFIKNTNLFLTYHHKKNA